MAKLSILLIVLILKMKTDLVTNEELSLIESFLDNLVTQVVKIGDPDYPLLEDMKDAKNYCEKIDGKFVQDSKQKVFDGFKGTPSLTTLLVPVAEAIAVDFSGAKIPLCVFLKNGQEEKAKKMAIETNKHIEEAQKVRIAFLTVMKDAIEPGTKVTLPELVCYIKKFMEKTIAVHPDKDHSKEQVKVMLGMLINGTVRALEKKGGKAVVNCQLPEATSNPIEYNSFLIPIFKSLEYVKMK